MDLSNFMRRYADEIGGQFTDYDPENSILIIPVPGGRAQTVLGSIRKSELFNRRLIYFSSKVCAAQRDLDYGSLLEQTAYFNYCRFAVRENFLQVEAVAAVENISEGMVKEMLQEVANLADQYEMKLTGADVQ